MGEEQFLGYLLLGIITLGAFVAVIMKFVQPINDLRVVIQKLNDTIDTLKSDNATQSRRLDRHGEQIDKLDHRLGKVETKIDMYHGKHD